MRPRLPDRTTSGHVTLKAQAADGYDREPVSKTIVLEQTIGPPMPAAGSSHTLHNGSGKGTGPKQAAKGQSTAVTGPNAGGSVIHSGGIAALTS